MQQEQLYHYVAFYNIETQEKNLIHKVETIAACITFLRHRRRRRRRRRCLCGGNSSEQYSIALDSIISIRGCDRGSGSQQQQQYSSLASQSARKSGGSYVLRSIVAQCGVVGREVRSFASTAYLLTWSWLLTDCPGTYVLVRTQQARAVQEVPLHCTVQWYGGCPRLLFLVGLDPPASFSVLLCSLRSFRSFSLSLLTSSSRRSQCKSMHAH